MHITLILLAAAGQVVTALDPHVTHLPRAANQEDNLATITTLVDGHLPTCFTGHPTHPCPTNGPGVKRDMVGDLAGNPVGDLPHGLNEIVRIVPIEQIDLTASGKPSLPTGGPEAMAGPRARAGPRDAPMEAWDKEYVPHPSEWAIPGKFKFTDSIAHDATAHKPIGYNSTARYSTGHNSAARYSSGHNHTAPSYAAHNSTAPSYMVHNSTASNYTATSYVVHNSTAPKYKVHNSTAPSYMVHNSTAPSYTAHYSNGTTASTVSSKTSSIEKYHVAPTAVIPQSSGHVDHYNNHYAHHHNKAQHNNNHGNHLGGGDTYVHTSAISESVTVQAYSQTTDPAVLPSKSHEQHDVANSSEAHMAGSIGTLLSAPMFPGMMRPATTNTSPYAAAVTSSKVESKVDDKLDAYSTTRVQEASISTPCAGSESSSSSSAMSMYDVKPVTMATSPRPINPSEAQPTASYKAADQHTARHFVS